MKNLAVKLLGIIILIGSLGIGWFWQSVNTFSNTPLRISAASIDFTIEPGTSLTSLARQLKTMGLIDSVSHFIWMIRLQGLPDKIQKGEYQIPSGITPKELLALFAGGKVKQYAFTIVEGWTVSQLLKAMRQDAHIVSTLAEKSDADIKTALHLNAPHLEGQFLPDTYYFPAGTSDVDFLSRANAAMEKVLSEQWENRASDISVKTPYEAHILASIVEKETAVSSERKKIAGVFSRRLTKNMRLQTDPTVIYGLGKSFDGNLKKKHLKDSKNPYNTYRIKGLPPTPIALPGVDAINAVLHPEPGDELYFVAKGDGSHHFSSTMKEHNKAVRKYQIRQRKTDYRSTPQNKEPG